MREELHKRIIQFYENVSGKCKSTTVKHFQEENIPQATCYRILSHRLIKNLPKSGRPVVKATPAVKKTIKRMFNIKDNISLRAAADKLHLSQAYVHKIKTR